MEDHAEEAGLLEPGSLDRRHQQTGQRQIGNDDSEPDGQELVRLHVPRHRQVDEDQPQHDHQALSGAYGAESGGPEEVQ